MNDQPINVAMVGLDTSHTIEFAKRLHAPDCKPELKVLGLRVTGVMRYPSRYQSEPDQDKRQAQLEAWGLRVTRDLKEATSDCDVIMLEANDGAQHREWFERLAPLGKPVFIDKPPADTLANAQAIWKLAAEKKLLLFSSSGLRFAPQLLEACKAIPAPKYAYVCGPLGGGPAGCTLSELIVWYGVHTFEALELAMGRDAASVRVVPDDQGAVAIVAYPDGRRGLVELTNKVWLYAGTLRSADQAAFFQVPVPYMVHNLTTDTLTQVRDFFVSRKSPVAPEDTLAVMAMLDAAARSARSGKAEKVGR